MTDSQIAYPYVVTVYAGPDEVADVIAVADRDAADALARRKIDAEGFALAEVTEAKAEVADALDGKGGWYYTHDAVGPVLFRAERQAA
jgi:hypothetical protein